MTSAPDPPFEHVRFRVAGAPSAALRLESLRRAVAELSAAKAEAPAVPDIKVESNIPN